MEDWDFKIKNTEQLKVEVLRLTKLYSLDSFYPKGQLMILETLHKIRDPIFNDKPVDHKKQYGYLLHYLEYPGSNEFFKTEDGKAIIEVFFYFAYKWEPGDNGRKKIFHLNGKLEL